MTPSKDSMGAHISDGEIARYLDRKLTVSEREQVESHLASCEECRRAVVESERLLKKVRPRGALGAMITVAAVALLFVGVRLNVARNHSAVETPVRGTDGKPTLAAYAPDHLTGNSVRFAWQRAPRGVSYKLSVTDGSSVAIWSITTADTVAMLPSGMTLKPAETYYWVVDALTADGSTYSTGVREFRVRE